MMETQCHSIIFRETSQERQIIDIVFIKLNSYFEKPMVTKIINKNNKTTIKNNPEYCLLYYIDKVKVIKRKKEIY